MTAATCVRCGRPMPDQAYVCQPCATHAAERLALVAECTPAARDVARGLSRRSSGGGSSGKPGSRLPLDLAATAKLDAVENELGTWARHCGEERGRGMVNAGEDPIVHAARYLAANLEWLRHRPEADEALTDIDACLRVVRSVARGPAEQRYLGPCGATLLEENDPGDPEQATFREYECDGDVYGRPGAQNGTCRTCGAQVDQDQRRAWLDDEVRQHVFRAAEIASAYGIRAGTIRVWHHRGQLAAHGHDAEDRPLFNVGDVLDLAAADAARRETARATRERRAAKAAESEHVA